jgi:CheY-like chemotaxis protein
MRLTEHQHASPPVVLCIDDDSASLAMRKLLLQMQGYAVVTVTTGAIGIALARDIHCDVVVLDFEMPFMNGDEVAQILKEEHPELPSILLTGFAGDIPKTLLSRIDARITKGSGDFVLSIARILQQR